MKDYVSGEDVAMKLDRTYCRYNGLFYYVNYYQDSRWYNIGLMKVSNPNRLEKIIDHRDPLFDSSAPELGYYNGRQSCIYLTRNPTRSNNQGLRAENLTSNQSMGFISFASKSFEDFLNGNYPSYNKAMNDLMGTTVKSVAISRDWALEWIDSMKLGLYYKTRLMGLKQGDNFLILPSKESSFHRKTLIKSGLVPVAT